MDDQAECRSDQDYAGRPLAVHWQGRRLAVTRLIDAWRLPQGKGYLVQTEYDLLFELVYLELEDRWEISQRQMFTTTKNPKKLSTHPFRNTQ